MKTTGHSAGNRRYDALILDMDGTLVDTERALLDLWESTAREMGHIFARDVLISTVGTTYADTLSRMAEVYPDAPHDDIRKETSRRFQVLRAAGRVGLRPGAMALLDAVAPARLKLGLCTSTRRASAEATLASVGILDRFASIVCGDEVAAGKPDPAPYLLSAARLGVAPGACLAVEDSPSGARSALAAGMAVAVVPDMIPVPEDVAARATVLSGLSQVFALLSLP
ncbi:MAG: HAD family phosphatase [Clostridiales bacterium]|jgi:HAD superfamily hydrolase (TIGR01509 family)|nr:HAD family phosphatase [Clostridiales bacterium]